MPNKNEDFYNELLDIDKLEDSEDFDSPEELATNIKLRAAALEELLKAEPSKPELFRKAISAHKKFWAIFNSLELEALDKDGAVVLENGAVVLVKNEEIESDKFLDPTDKDTPFSKLHQLAAEKRVSLGLKNASQEILVAILSNNPDECRAYLASKPEFGKLNALPDWIKNTDKDTAATPSAKAKSLYKGILTDDAIDDLKEEASALLLKQLIEKCEDQQLLVNLLSAGKKADLNKHANKLLSSPPEKFSFTFSSDSIEKYDDENGSSLADMIGDRIQTLKKGASKQQFEKYVTELGQPDKPPKLALEATSLAAFKDALPAGARDFLVDDKQMNLAKGQLGARYLQAFLPAQPKDKLVAALNAANALNTAITAIKELTGRHDYVDHAVKPENLNSIRKSMIQGVINQATLKKLTTADFQQGLKDLGISKQEWLGKKDIEELQKTARERRFQLEIPRATQLGSEHPTLLAAFKDISLAKQTAILDKPGELHHLLKAEKSGVIKHYLGLGNTPTENGLVEAIVKENTRLAFFNKINNSAIAKVLANFKPPIEMTQVKIDEINKAVASFSGNYELVDLAKHDLLGPADDGLFGPAEDAPGEVISDFTTFFNVIKTQCGIAAPNENRLREEFRNKGNRTDILAQHAFNEELFKVYNASTDVDDKRLLGVFLSVQKSIGFESAVDISKIKETLKKATSVEDFINKLGIESKELGINAGKLQTNADAFKSSLSKELPSSLFYDMKKNVLNADLKSDKEEVVDGATEQMEVQIKALHDIMKPLTKHRDTFALLAKVNPIHLFNPSFQGKARDVDEVLKQRHKDLAADCDLVVDELRRNKQILVSYLESIPNKDDLKGKHPEIEKLRGKITAEIAEVDANLKIYVMAQQKEGQILKAIADVEAGGKNYYYNANGVTRTPRKIGGKSKDETEAAIEHSRAEINCGQLKNFILGDKPKEDEEMVFDVKHTSEKGDKKSFGRFTEQLEPGISTVKDGVVTKALQGKFEIEKFPKTTAAKVNFSMAMAAQILANMDGPPTKENPIVLKGENEEELGCLWTALVILGEKTPNMKFDSKVIEVYSGAFDPRSQKGIIGFTGESYYKSYFKNETLKGSIKQKTEGLATVIEDNAGATKSEKKIVAKVLDAKDDLQLLKAKAVASIAKEGVAPKEEEAPSSSAPGAA